MFDKRCCADERGRSRGVLNTSLGRSSPGCSEGDARGKQGQAAPWEQGSGQGPWERCCGAGLRAGFCGHRMQLACVVHPSVSHALPLVLFAVGVTQGAEVAESRAGPRNTEVVFNQIASYSDSLSGCASTSAGGGKELQRAQEYPFQQQLALKLT